MEEYNPDNPTEQTRPQGEISGFEGRPRVPIDDRTPYSETHPKYPEKYNNHINRGVPMMLCPECGKLGRHMVQPDDQPTAPGMSRIGGEVCDICGGGDTYEVAF